MSGPNGDQAVVTTIVLSKGPFRIFKKYYLFLQQVQNKVSFPREPKVSTECRKLVTKILAPLKVRVKIPQILADPWLNPNQPAKDEEVDTTQVIMSTSSAIAIPQIDMLGDTLARLCQILRVKIPLDGILSDLDATPR